MKPRCIKESLRVTTTYKSMEPDKHQAFFEISNPGEEPQTLVLITTQDYQKATHYVIKKGHDNFDPKQENKLLCREGSWQNEVLKLMNQSPYSTAHFKELILSGITGKYQFTPEYFTAVKEVNQRQLRAEYNLFSKIPHMRPNQNQCLEESEDSDSALSL